jgi:hypothetical protein
MNYWPGSNIHSRSLMIKFALHPAKPSLLCVRILSNDKSERYLNDGKINFTGRLKKVALLIELRSPPLYEMAKCRSCQVFEIQERLLLFLFALTDNIVQASK